MPAGPKVGESAPPLKLPDLKGKKVNLAGFKGSETLVLFWNPGCGFCQQMLPDIKQWEATSPEGAPKLLVVSAGSEEANKEMGLTSPVLLDQQFAAGRAFGASGTPSAVLVDAEGKVASEVTVGAPAVMELAGADRTTT
jgi:thiol-disulfide isomerase/thioredoxin